MLQEYVGLILLQKGKQFSQDKQILQQEIQSFLKRQFPHNNFSHTDSWGRTHNLRVPWLDLINCYEKR